MSCTSCRCTCPKETPEEEGRRLYQEGVGLSQLWGDVSEDNIGDFSRVVAAFSEAANDPQCTLARTRALQQQ